MIVTQVRLVRALEYAVEKHGGQMRKGNGAPYVTHLLGVASLVGEHGGDEDDMMAALLHDVVEDCGGRPVLVDVRARFGDIVADIVDGCTDSWTETNDKLPWLERKSTHVARLRQASVRVLRVCAADKLHNARCIAADLRREGIAAWNRFSATREQSLWYYRSVVDTFLRRSTADVRDTPLQQLFEELERVVVELERG